MLTCPDCGIDNLPHRRYCHACGALLGMVPCDRCGFANADGDRYCGGCGQELIASSAGSTVGEAEPGAPIQEDLVQLLNEVAAEGREPEEA